MKEEAYRSVYYVGILYTIILLYRRVFKIKNIIN